MTEKITSFLFLVIVLWFLSSPNAIWSDSYTVYLEYCNDTKSSPLECTQEISVMKVSFLAIPETQIVVRKTGSFWVEKYKGCAVFSRDSWVCAEGNMHVQVVEGRYYNALDYKMDKDGELTRISNQISRMKYYLREIKSVI